MTGTVGHHWSPAQLATLARIFETFAPGTDDDAPRRAELAAETLEAAADHDELRLLRLALRMLELAPANAVTGGQWGRFSRLDQARREALLLSWSTSRIARLRTTYQVLKRLALFFAYADDGGGEEPHNALWPEIGYGPAEPVVTPAATAQPIEVDRRAAGQLEFETDVVVVGSGAGGGVAAARLAAAGHDVLVVEQGPPANEDRLPRTEATAFRDLYLDRGTTASHDLGISILAGSVVGGGTTINWTTILAPPDWLRTEWATEHGLAGFDGEQTDADLARLRAELDLQPPTVIPPKDRLVLDGASALGWESAPTERNAGPCTDCGSCGFGCRRAEKRSGPRVHLAAAIADGARLLADARVDRITLSRGAATGVIGRLKRSDGTLDGRPIRVRARSVVVAGGALRSPLLLQRSGVGHPALGRFLRLHPVVAVAARMPMPVEMWIGPTQAARSLHHLHPGGFVVESAPAHPGLIGSALPWQGGTAQAALMREIRLYAPLIGIIRDHGSGDVTWSRGGHPRIRYRLDGRDAATARLALAQLSRLARAGGADHVRALATPGLSWAAGDGDASFERFLGAIAAMPIAPNRVTLFSAHQMGSARAGSSPRDHPCDAVGRVRAGTQGAVYRRLHVADASLFPTPSGVNPMLTVMAIAERTARAVLDDL